MTAWDQSLADLISLALPYAHDAPCDDALLDALAGAIRARGVEGDPPPPTVSGLHVRREGLPDWWIGDGNLLLAAPGASLALSDGVRSQPGRGGNVAVAGAGAQVLNLAFSDAAGLVVLGDRAQLAHVHISASHGGTVLIGEDTTAGLFSRVDGRNGGAVIVGADGMWSSGVNLVTDDMHAIRELGSARRVNAFGGRIVIGRHVWLGEDSRITGGARIGQDTVVGLGSVVGKTTLPPNSVCVGAPCKPGRLGTTWTREDLP